MPFRILEDEAEAQQEEENNNKKTFKILDDEEAQQPSRFAGLKESSKNLGKDVLNPRNAMQSAIGTAKGGIYSSPAGPAAILADIATPPAIEQALLEEIASEREMPASIKKAIGFTSPEGQSDIDYDIASKSSKDLFNKITNGEGVVGALVSSPFRAIGIDTTPQNGIEGGVRNASELLTALGSPGATAFEIAKEMSVLEKYAPERFKNLSKTIFDDLPKFVQGLFKNKEKDIEKVLLGQKEVPKSIQENIPRSVHEQDKKILTELQTGEQAELAAKEAAERPSFLPKEVPNVPETPKHISPSLKGRVSEGGEDIGMRPPTSKPPQNIEEEVGQIFSPTEFRNTTQGGESIKRKIIELDEKKYRNVNSLYQKSRELNSNINEIHPKLYHELEDRIEQLSSIPEPSGPQKQLLTAMQNISDALAETTLEEGEKIFVGYKPISNQTLIDQIQSLRQKIDYDFTHGNAKNIFKPTINDIQNAVRSAAEQSGNEAAVKAFDEARAGYKQWAETFDNDYIRPIRNTQNKDYSKILKGSLDVDEFNQLRTVLDTDPQGKLIASGIQRELVNKYLGKYYDKPIQNVMKNFNKDLRELEAVITPEQAAEVRRTFIENRKNIPNPFRAKKLNLTEQDRKLAKHLNMEPEDISEKFNSRSGIQQLKKDLNKTENGKQLFETRRRQKVRDILRENHIEKDFTGDDLYKTLNKRENFELLSELIGEEETEAARLLAKEIGKKSVRNQKYKSVAGHVVGLKFLKYILALV